MQILVILSLVGILGSVGIALLYDLKRSKNQKLREALVDMKVQQVVRQRQLTACQPAPSHASVQPSEPFAPAASPDKASVETSPEIDFTSRWARRRAASASIPADAGIRAEDMTSKKALSDWLLQRAVARAEQKTAEQKIAAEQEPQPASMHGPVLVDNTPAPPLGELMTERLPEPAVIVSSPAAPDFGTRFEPVIIDEFLWASLFEPQNQAKPQPEPEPVPEAKSQPEPEPQPELAGIPVPEPLPIEPLEPPEPLEVPCGWHDLAVLNRLSDSDRDFSGLVVSIGISQSNVRPTSGPNFMASIAKFVRRLLLETEFGCRTNEEEFVIVCPGQVGPAAERRLGVISERFWDYQLRALGSSSLIFSLGGMNVKHKHLSEAIAAAYERMSQTRRTRRAIVMPARRRAV